MKFAALAGLFAAASCWAVAETSSGVRSFIVQNDQFVKDGEIFNLRSGDLHYFRIPRAYWRDRLQRLKAMGLNSVTMYVAWNYHETVEGQITSLDEVTGFLEAAHSEKLLVFLRPGPYICAEWDFGGLPTWLLWSDKPGMKLRTYEPYYIAAVDKWMNALYSTLSPYIYSKGGPIALVQIENEFGGYGDCSANPDDARYMNHLLDLAMEHLGSDIVYTTVDWGEGHGKDAKRLEQGSPWKGDQRVLATVDGGLGAASTYAETLQRQKDFNAPGRSPKMWSELYVGWLTHWTEPAANKSSADFLSGVGNMLDQNASFSLYMAHGGTNFGFWNGANDGFGMRPYRPDITSYDYSAPISEAADHNIGSDGGDLYAAVQDAIAARRGPPDAPEPAARPKVAYGKIALPLSTTLFGNLDSLDSCAALAAKDATRLQSFEDLRHSYGFVLYSVEAKVWEGLLEVSAEAARDRVQVFVDGHEVGVAYRPLCPTNISLPAGHSMDLLVENMGRINSDKGMYDYKGYLGAPPVAGTWRARCLPLHAEQVQALPFAPERSSSSGPIFRHGMLEIQGKPADTFLDMGGFSKGYVWVNGINLGRYWEDAGPQHTLYVPAPFLQAGKNEFIVLDLHRSVKGSLESVAAPRYGKAAEVEMSMI